MTNLENALRRFSGANDESTLTKQFEDLAKCFLYGGYYNVYDKYRIYIRKVEFYFHPEEGSVFTNIKDDIVYHRNNRYVDGEVPYFPFMSFHAHPSGIDVTFENKALKYRASALIRAYEVYDIARGCFLVYDTKQVKFVPWKSGKKYNEQSTYLYYVLNGFGGDIRWVDEGRERSPKLEDRKNAHDHNWGFRRVEDIEL
jgi:hypothetical protein